MSRAFEEAGIMSCIVKSDKERLEYRRGGLEFEKYPKTFELPCLVDSPLVKGYAPFPIIPQIFDVVKGLKPDIVNVSEHISFPTWLFSTLKRDWKTVLTEHGSCWRGFRDGVYNLIAAKLLVRRIDGFVGIGLRAKSFLEGLGAQKVDVIPNPIDCQLFKPSLSHDKKQNIVLYVGKADTFRGLHVLLPAMKLVRKRIKDAKLQIIGQEGNLSSYIRAHASGVEYLGPKPHHTMPAYYNQAKLLANPFTHAIAGCTCATSEALACGIPVVVTEYLDFPFLWHEGEVGFMTSFSDTTSAGLADAIIKALTSGEEIQGRCRQIAVREFSYRSVGTRYLEVFRRVLNTCQ